MLFFQEFKDKRPNNGEYFTIAIDGRGGSGKSTFAELLVERTNGLLLLHGDDYFEPVERKTEWGWFNDKRFFEDVIQPMSYGKEFNYRPYDWHSNPHIKTEHISNVPAICVERCYTFEMPIEWDMKIWVETPKDICFERGMKRDNGINNYNVQKVWREVWQPREDEYISRVHPNKIANWVIDGTVSFEKQLISTEKYWNKEEI